MGKASPSQRRFYFAEWAKKNGVRQVDVIKATGLTKGFISGLWNGAKEPSADTLARIAAVIGVPPLALLSHPASFPTRAFAAVERLSAEEQKTTVEMLEGLAARRRT